jgi:hypothetical protein
LPTIAEVNASSKGGLISSKLPSIDAQASIYYPHTTENVDLDDEDEEDNHHKNNSSNGEEEEKKT